MKQKRIFLAVPFMIIICLLCGCVDTKTDAANFECYFENNTEVNLVINTPQSSVIRQLVIKGELPNDFAVEFDENIIDYNYLTGEITAVGVGNTDIKVSYTLNSEKQVISLPVKVSSAVFAEDITSSKDKIVLLENGETYDIKSDVFVSNSNYNLSVEYFSSNEDIFSVDDNGNITPNSVGEATLIVKAIENYSKEEATFSFITESITVEVISNNFVTDLSLYDKNLKPLTESMLFYGNDNFYYGVLTVENFASDVEVNLDETSLASFEILEDKKYADGNQIFIPIEPLNYGEKDLVFNITLSADNGVLSFDTFPKTVTCFAYADENLYSVKTTNYLTTDELASGEFLTLDLESENGKYLLYKLGGSLNDKIEGHNNKNYFYALILFDKINQYCYNKIALSCEDSSVKIERLSDNVYYVEAAMCGTANINICANDGSNFSAIITFDVEEVDASSFEFYAENKISLILGENESVNLAVTNVEPAYATTSCEVNIQSESVCPVVLGEDKTTIYAVEAGNCFVSVTFDGMTRTYSVSVSESGNEIAPIPLEDSIFVLESKGSLSITFEVVDKNNNLIYDNFKLGIIILDESSAVLYDVVLNNVTFWWKESGVIKFVLVLYENDVIIDKSPELTIICL